METDEIWMCSIHPAAKLKWEEGGPTQPTVHGRWYCPICRQTMNEVLDSLEDSS